MIYRKSVYNATTDGHIVFEGYDDALVAGPFANYLISNTIVMDD